MLDWFNLILIALVLLIVVFIARAIRKTTGELSQSGLSGEEARRLAEQIRKRDVRCPQCDRQSSAMLGMKNRYKCDTCNHEFEGPEHMPV